MKKFKAFMKKLKYENIIFIVLVGGSVFNATLIASNGAFGIYSSFITLLVQIALWDLVRLGIRYIRKNPQTVANEIASLFKDK